jgi:transposase
MGTEVLVIAPQNWDEEHKHQVNDRFDAQVMCRRLSEYLSGHRRALSVVRIPTPEQEAERAQARYREQLRKEIRRLQARGRSLLLTRGLPVRGRWWQGRLWTWIEKEMPRWVVTQLAGWQSLLVEAERQVLAVEAELAAAAPASLFFGEGRLTHELLRRELLDPQRFQNPRQVGSYYGLCPSESTSGPRQRRGPITKHGHPRLRRLLVELAWRVARSRAPLPARPALAADPGQQSQPQRAQKSHRGRGPLPGGRSLAAGLSPRHARGARAPAKSRRACPPPSRPWTRRPLLAADEALKSL